MDAELELKYLEKLGKSDHKAFGILFKEYHPKVKSFLFGFVKDQELVADMTQDIFFKVWINRDNLSKIVSFGAYLFRMARNMVYDHYEHINVIEKYSLEQQELQEQTCSPEEDLYARELSLLIDTVVDRMPPQRKRIFIMSRHEYHSNDEISKKLNINKRTVENHITQALQDIRKELHSVNNT
ncbi:MAG: RNA polymerase sigma-70 factor [Tannerella sp.]|jgi:RNA polymerase sigma-70 factor (ECF subfamily)|nr:RNA polymerase sigma-70 factor [Tannerella sp.]